MIFCSDSLEFLRKQEDYSFDINYSDPPYALGSEVIVRPDGKVDYNKASDFMNKWEMPTGAYWEQWFKEAYRTLKYGGYCIMFGMDRQLLLFKYYACLAGFTEKQSLYWYYISNFPKATDLSKQIDKNAGATREKIGEVELKGNASLLKGNQKGREDFNVQGTGGTYTPILDITAPSTALAKKYDGYKYSISPLKQTNETILVFQKPYKTCSCLHDTLAYENGDNTCCCGALDIDGNRVGAESRLNAFAGNKGTGFTPADSRDEKGKGMFNGNVDGETETTGRYPAQTFINSETAQVLDRQSDIAEGGCSKILHKCDFEKDEHDLYFYNPKVNSNERNAGCDDMEDKTLNRMREDKNEATGLNKEGRFAPVQVKNNHPTLKPIKLNKNILSLFKTPNEQQIVYPFAGSGSEVIGGIKAGFTSYIGCEINQNYIDIANARIKFWKDFEGCELPTEQAIGQISIWEEIC